MSPEYSLPFKVYVFQHIGIITIPPVSLPQLWPLDLLSCCSVYLGFILLIGLLGFVSFIFAAKKYKYRERENILFCQMDVEEVYTHYLVQAPDTFDHSGELD